MACADYKGGDRNPTLSRLIRTPRVTILKPEIRRESTWHRLSARAEGLDRGVG
jgi:hypothetical protein